MRRIQCAALACLVWAGLAGGAAGDYLTKDGKLRGSLEIRVLQSGGLGVGGPFWKVEPDGSWVYGVDSQGKETTEARGKLGKEELAALVKDLNKYDVARLPTKKLANPMANPATVVVKWGKKESTLGVQGGREGAKPDPKTVDGRYSGLLHALQEHLKEKKE